VSASASARRRSREVALQALYALDLRRGRQGPAEGDAEAVFAGVAGHFEMPAAARDFARELVGAVGRCSEALDVEIAARARNWRVSRMACVDRNILRLAAWELMHTDTPTAVVLNEAVELAHGFGSDESPAFVNGILAALAKDLRDGSRVAPAEGPA